MSQIGDGSEPAGSIRTLSRAEIAFLAFVVIGLILLVGLAPLSRVVANGLPDPPNPVVPQANTAPRAGTSTVREVPVGLASGARIRTSADVVSYVQAAFGSAATAFMAVLRSGKDLPSSPVGYATNHVEYPYRYPQLEPVLDAAPPDQFNASATALGAALTVLAAQPSDFSAKGELFVDLNAGPAAYGVLNRARESGACAPQLDLLLLLASDKLTTAAILSQEEKRAETVCPHDPTAGWLVGQSQLRDVPLSFAATGLSADTVAHVRTATTTFTTLVGQYPNDAGIIAGLGDSYLRAGTHLLSSEPFAARHDLTSAIVQYNRVSALGDPRDAALGIGRALIGLGQPAEAAKLLEQYAESTLVRGPLLEMLISADESAHDFGAAEAAAKRLDQLGTSAYGDGVAFFPLPSGYSSSALDDASLPLSFGGDRLTGLSTALLAPGGAGGSVQDLSFIPLYRNDPGVTATQPYCASWSWRRDAILNGQAAQALTGWPADFTSVRPNRSCYTYGTLHGIAQTEAGQKVDPGQKFDGSVFSGDDISDAHQNLLRWAGNLPAARKAAEQWQAATGDKNATPTLRLGEIDYLMHRYNDAASEFALAARRSRLVAPGNDLAVDQAQLDRGAALLAAGRTSEGTQILRPLDQLGTQGFAYQNSQSEGSEDAVAFATVSYFACEQLADYEREAGDLHAAVEDYTTALSWSKQVNGGSGVRPEALNNNAALAFLGLGQTATAASLENNALASDALDPAFLMTAGFIADRAGNVAKAASYDRQTLQSDPGAFPAANDLGVELSREHHDQAAESALRQAVGANPSYALGWFNLGVLESKRGPAHLMASQGSLAKAYALDSSLKDRRHQMTIDASVYRTALDLSKPLPPKWSFAQLQRPAPAAAAGLLAVVALGFGLAKASGRGGSGVAEHWLDPMSEKLDSVRLLARLRHPALALAVTVITFLLAYLRHATAVTEVVTYLLGVGVLAATAMTARSTLAFARGVQLQQVSWMPGVALGLVTGALGLPWASLPVIQNSDQDDPRLHLAAPLTLAALSLVLFIESAWTHTPITQSWAVAALIMAASTLLPVGPLDGAHLGKAGIVTGAGVVGGALLVGLGLI
jgi:tetratricopeptide (TPR) repeat protein